MDTFRRSCLGLTALVWIAPCRVLAQLVPDATLPHPSIVRLEGKIQQIIGGTEVGNSLFHSFDRFNIGTGETAFFDNALNIENIITRVTGGQISSIDGLIRANGTANLFLLNPNGMIFGENARLEIGGSFFGSTAEQLVFADGGVYSATQPNAPPLLTVSVPIGLQLGLNPRGTLTNAGNLTVDTGQTLGIAGHSVTNTGFLGGGTVQVASNNIAIREGGTMNGAALSASLATGTVVLQAENEISIEENVTGSAGNGLNLQAGRSISIGSDRTLILNGGNLTARIDDERVNPSDRTSGTSQFLMNPGSQLLSGGGNVSIESVNPGGTINTFEAQIDTSSTVGNPSGNIVLWATGDLNLGSLNTSIAVGFEKAGDVTVVGTEGSIWVWEPINADTIASASLESPILEPSGIAGNIRLQAAGDISVHSILSSGSPGGAISAIAGGRFQQLGDDSNLNSGTFGSQAGKDITITATSIALRDGVFAQTWNSGTGGNLILNASDDIVLSQKAEVITTTFGSGNAGDITLNARRLTIRDIDELEPGNAGLGSSTDPNTSGNGGNVTIDVWDSIELVGNQPGAVTPDVDRLSTVPLLANTGIFGFSLGTGKVGDITIDAGRLTIQDGAGISTAPSVLAEGGDITIEASEIFIQGLAGIGTTTFGLGNAGDLTIKGDRIILTDGAILVTDTLPITRSLLDSLGQLDVIDEFTLNLLTAIGNSGTGDAGDLTVQTGNLSVRNGSVIGAATSTQGNGGRLRIEATDSVSVTGRTADATLPSAIFSGVRLFPGSPTLGNGGNVEIRTPELRLDGGGEISAATFSQGSSGSVDIDANRLILNNGSQVSVSGRGGNIAVNADAIELDNSRISADTQMGDRGNITLNTDTLQLRRGSRMTTNATGNATGGKIAIDTETLTALENSDISANSSDARGGTITINAQGIFGTQFRVFPTTDSDITATGGTPNSSGTVELNAPEIDSSSGLVEFSQEAVNLDRLLADNPCRHTRNSSFTITGRNGLPNDPLDFLPAEAIWQDWRIPRASASASPSETFAVPEFSNSQRVEAQSWVRHPDGTIELVARSDAASDGYLFGNRTPNCPKLSLMD